MWESVCEREGECVCERERENERECMRVRENEKECMRGDKESNVLYLYGFVSGPA